jgi:putative endonuclease
MPNKREVGGYGEQLAADYLTAKGYRIIERNFNCRTGEIDIIAWHGDCLVFVEVKYRKNLNYGHPAEAVSKPKQRSIKQTALYYIMLNKIADTDMRFDVIAILDTGQPEIEHIENAFY